MFEYVYMYRNLLAYFKPLDECDIVRYFTFMRYT